MPSLQELLMFANSGPRIEPLNATGLGILQDMKNVNLAKQAMGGDRMATAQLAGKDPYQARTILGFQQQDSDMQAQREQKLQEMRGRIATNYLTATDKAGYLQGMAQSLSQSSGDPAAAELLQDLQEITQAYGQNPEQINQFMAAEAARFGQVNANITPARVRELELLTQGMSPEEKQKAIRTELGLEARAGMSAQERIAGDPGLSQNVADSQGLIAGTKEDRKLDAQLGKKPQLEADVEAARIKAKDDTQKEINRPKAEARVKSLTTKGDRIVGMIDKAISNVGTFTAGPIGSIASSVRGTPAYDLKQTAVTIKANLGFDALQEMRDNSPTGGALGQVAVQELEALQAAVANLDIGQSPEQLVENLNMVREHYSNYMEAVRASYNDQYSNGQTPPPQNQQIQEGAIAINPQTGQRVKLVNGQWVPL